MPIAARIPARITLCSGQSRIESGSLRVLRFPLPSIPLIEEYRLLGRDALLVTANAVINSQFFPS
jgi:hypothetical protein